METRKYPLTDELKELTHRNDIRTAAQAICPECPDTEKAVLAIKEAI